MGPELEKAIQDLSLRMRLIRAAQEGDAPGSLSEREALILQQLLERPEMTVSEIAQSWPNVSESTISITLTRLWREKGLVSKTIKPDNQRVTLVKLTDKGRQTIQKHLEQQTERFNALFHAINVTPEEKEVLIRICTRASKFLDRYLSAMQNQPSKS
ncbi:MAG TPA: winged helix DNA-binding protein [Anaerohalosphaeraceae bacterium]|nr:winged helix DNA-binding protein [Anaerohalosphaeraceae bacterium]HOL89471.1 winged helix DNA-binding protein [Anaerohalosphaeraceae bacterium]HPP55254.1 winged helix DNA-binding protein [Anaerohalosphaeraceae bacterium]